VLPQLLEIVGNALEAARRLQRNHRDRPVSFAHLGQLMDRLKPVRDNGPRLLSLEPEAKVPREPHGHQGDRQNGERKQELELDRPLRHDARDGPGLSNTDRAEESKLTEFP